MNSTTGATGATGATGGVKTAYPIGAPMFPPFSGIRVSQFAFVCFVNHY